MPAQPGFDPELRRLVRDPVTRLAMDSDGVSEEALLRVLHRARAAILARAGSPLPASPVRLAAWRDR